MDIYSREFLHYYKSQPSRKDLHQFTHFGKDANTSCGDEVSLKMDISENKINDVGYIAEGCIVCQAAASILSEHIIDNSDFAKVRNLSKEEFLQMLGIELTPSRQKCALLSYNALINAIK